MIQMKIYMVSTPIGNLQDITIRALKVLRNADVIMAEDSRVTRKLLNKYNIKKRIVSFHKFNEQKTISQFFKTFENVESIAIVSDAGTPLISDPGRYLIEFAYKNNIKVIPIPGASSITTLLSIVPFKCDNFIFLGFLEKKIEKRTKQLKKFIKKELPFMFFESPKRIFGTLEILKGLIPENKIFIGRELTKKFEEIFFDKIENVYESIKDKDIKGELVCIADCKKGEDSNENILEDINILKDINLSTKDIATFISKKYNISKNTIYNILKKD